MFRGQNNFVSCGKKSKMTGKGSRKLKRMATADRYQLKWHLLILFWDLFLSLEKRKNQGFSRVVNYP
jgi:hypothetical protein